VNANDLWFTARGAGLSALLSLSIATACGAFGSLPGAAPAARVMVQYLHRTAAALGIGLIVVHVASIVLDSKSHIGFAGALVPFAAHYRPNAVALGSCTAYLLLLVAALGLARGRLAAAPAAARRWRAAHSLGYLLWATAVLHGLLAGTDRGQGWVVLLVVGCVLLVLAAGIVRLLSLDDTVDGAAGDSSTPRLAERPIGTAGRPAGRQPRNVLR
jgi:methionine sulfoxide reductase heme-binding subunit